VRCLEEDAAAHAAIQHLRERKFGLQNGEIVAISGLAISAGKGMGQPSPPFPQQGVNFRGGETVTKSLQTFWIGTGEDAIIEGFISNALLVELALHVLMPVQTELGVIGKIGTELQEEGPKSRSRQ
jgi:hypothetical protein